ncbi:hypothetical protein EWG10_11665 [Salmonella enterica subsp. enterica serovar Napoli]|nr:hypothetical protein [Salmonella enterica subsp. enterica serovar Napoli]ECB3569000.1 hypothetical protein [Salmonella enterica subsp. enterica serovar Napoli]EEK4624805.1 hypothetical protein [Salmonella enterica]
MTISDTKLRSLYGKPYSGPSEITDSYLVLYGIWARVNLAGISKNAWTKMGLFTEGHNAVSLNSMRIEAGLDPGQWQDG